MFTILQITRRRKGEVAGASAAAFARALFEPCGFALGRGEAPRFRLLHLHHGGRGGRRYVVPQRTVLAEPSERSYRALVPREPHHPRLRFIVEAVDADGGVREVSSRSAPYGRGPRRNAPDVALIVTDIADCRALRVRVEERGRSCPIRDEKTLPAPRRPSRARREISVAISAADAEVVGVEGDQCRPSRGSRYGAEEAVHPMRTGDGVRSAFPVRSEPVSAKTVALVEKSRVRDVARAISSLTVSLPVHAGRRAFRGRRGNGRRRVVATKDVGCLDRFPASLLRCLR